MLRRTPFLLAMATLSVACAPAATTPEAPPAAPSGVALSADDRAALPKPTAPLGLPISAGDAFAGKDWKLTRLDTGVLLQQGQADAAGRFTPVLSPELATVPVKLVAAGGGIAAGEVLMGGVVGGVLAANGAWLQSANVISAGGGAVISAGGGAVISAGGGAVISAGGGAVISAGGGALQAPGAQWGPGGYLLAQAPGPRPLAELLTPPAQSFNISPAQLFAAQAQDVALRHLATHLPPGGGPAIALAVAQRAVNQLGQVFNQDFQPLPNAAQLVGSSLNGPMPPELSNIVQQRQQEIEAASGETGQAMALGASLEGQALPPDLPPFSFGPLTIDPPSMAELAAALPPLAPPPDQPPPGAPPEGPPPGPPQGPPPDGPPQGPPGPEAPNGQPPVGPPPGGPPPADPGPAPGGGGGGGSAPDSDPVPFVPVFASPGVGLSGPYAPSTALGGPQPHLLPLGWSGFQSLAEAFLPQGKGRALVLQHGATPNQSVFYLGARAQSIGGQMRVPVWRAPILAQGQLGPFVLAGSAPLDCTQGTFVGQGPHANVVGTSAASTQYHVATVANDGRIAFTSPVNAQLASAVLNPAVGFTPTELVVAGGRNLADADVDAVQSVPLALDGSASGNAVAAGNLHQKASGGKLFLAPNGFLAWANPLSVADVVDAPSTLVLTPGLGGWSSSAGPLRQRGGSDATLVSALGHQAILLAGGATQPNPEALVLADRPASWGVVLAPTLRYAFARKGSALTSFGDGAYLIGGTADAPGGRVLGGVELGRLLP